MKGIRKIVILAVIVIGVFAFSKKESKISKSSLNLTELNAVDILSKQEFECRPSSEVMFYVETELVNKSRGYNTINASIFVLDRVSGESNLLANENIIIPAYKDAVLNYKIDTSTSDCEKLNLINGDKILGSNANTPYCFHQLIKYKEIYNSYVNSTNKLLHINRTI